MILSQDKTTPTVAVNVWYKVGSKNEAVGRTGFAHLFEHVMFTGSGNVPYGLHDKLTEGVGGMNNGTTNNDRTTYFETVPSNYLETALWLEADRMGYLLDTLDLAKLNAQRDIVKNERRQSVRQPAVRARLRDPGRGDVSGVASLLVGRHRQHGGPVSAASEEDVKNFFRLYYAPNNAYLSIVGDFDAAQAKAWVAKYFGDIPRGKPITRPKVAPVTLERRDSASSTRTACRCRGSTSSGRRSARRATTASRSTCSATILDRRADGADHQGAGLRRAGSGGRAAAVQSTNEDVGEFMLTLTPRPGHTLTDARGGSRRDHRAAEEGRTDRGGDQKAIAGEELAFVSGLESNLGKAFQLADGAGYHGDAGYFRTEYQKTLSVTADDVKRVANKYLTAAAWC